MNLEFDDGDAGFWEARTIYDMAAHYVTKSEQAGDVQLLEFLKDAALSHMNRLEYAALREEVGTSVPEWPAASVSSASRPRADSATRAPRRISSAAIDAPMP